MKQVTESNWTGIEFVTKKAVIAITFGEESSEKTNDELASEIFNELNEGRIIIPWCKKIDFVTVRVE